jgi:phosphohistidine phosphatase
VADHDRPLNPRGRRDAPVAGRLVAQTAGPLDVALVSTAVRAQETFDLAAIPVGERRDEAGLYLASPAQMLARAADVHAATVLIVAHNPGTEELAAMLADDPASPEYSRMLTKFPTAAFAVLCADRPLAQWGPGCARLVAFEVGRG